MCQEQTKPHSRTLFFIEKKIYNKIYITIHIANPTAFFNGKNTKRNLKHYPATLTSLEIYNKYKNRYCNTI